MKSSKLIFSDDTVPFCDGCNYYPTLDELNAQKPQPGADIYEVRCPKCGEELTAKKQIDEKLEESVL